MVINTFLNTLYGDKTPPNTLTHCMGIKRLPAHSMVINTSPNTLYGDKTPPNTLYGDKTPPNTLYGVKHASQHTV